MVAEKPAVPSVGASLASYLPRAAFDPGAAAAEAAKAGYGGLQLLPVRGMDVYTNFSLPVWYVEGPWNNRTNLWAVVSGKITRDPKAPTLMDFACFPKRPMGLWENPNTSFFSDHPRLIVHSLEPLEQFADQRILLEPSPGLWLTSEEILEKVLSIRQAPFLALDLWHLRRGLRPDELCDKPAGMEETYGFPLGHWYKSLRQLLPYAVVIHVSPRRDDGNKELFDFLAGKRTELGNMMEFIREFDDLPRHYVVEATIGFSGLWKPRKVIDVMARLHDRVAQFLCI